MPRSMAGRLAAVGTAMCTLAGPAHGDIVWIAIADAAVATSPVIYATAPFKKFSPYIRCDTPPDTVLARYRRPGPLRVQLPPPDQPGVRERVVRRELGGYQLPALHCPAVHMVRDLGVMSGSSSHRYSYLVAMPGA
jgi:hypothetical protein